MIASGSLTAFALLAFGMALSPGPNMAYLVSRSVCQGRGAGLVSLGGVALGFFAYLLLAAFGITAVLFAVPYAYDTLRFAGALYLGWLAWNAFRPNGSAPFDVRGLPAASHRRLFAMGLLTNLLNPKVAFLYLSLLPQFVDPAAGSVLAQSLLLGTVQIAVAVAVNGAIVLAAGKAASFLAAKPVWARLQRRLMGTVLAGLAVRLALEGRR